MAKGAIKAYPKVPEHLVLQEPPRETAQHEHTEDRLDSASHP